MIVFIYVNRCSTQFLYQMMLVSFNSNTTGVTSGAEIMYPIINQSVVNHSHIIIIYFYNIDKYKFLENIH